MSSPREAAKPKLRCAVYTRKSSEEGLEQAFNSLQAQREACEAYIRSQAGEGWTLVRTAYDDGGVSGGTMEREALLRLLADVDAGRLDVVVVYKVDRLTRALADFAKIVERFDRAKVSFVSVTQQFNTTTSMGRLTLNVLLSFAQFEREVTGERIRDKIAASKKKGMWMGGCPPLGYDLPVDLTTRALVANPAEAERVRHIFARYLQLGSVHRLCAELAAQGVQSKRRVTKRGRETGGQPFSRGALFHLLKSRVYLGEIVHGEHSYPGLHPPIVERELFDAVQSAMANQRSIRRKIRTGGEGTAQVSPLKGRLFDAAGSPMSPTFARGRDPQRRYRYYVSSSRLCGTKAQTADVLTRLSASALEASLLERLRAWTANDQLGWPESSAAIWRVDAHPDALVIRLDPRALPGAPRDKDRRAKWIESRLAATETLELDPLHPEHIIITLTIRTRLRGGRSYIITPDGRPLSAPQRRDQTLIKGLRSAHTLMRKLNSKPTGEPYELLKLQACSNSYERRLIALAFLAPDIQDAILQGRQPLGLNMERLMAAETPAAWADQRALFGFAQPD